MEFSGKVGSIVPGWLVRACATHGSALITGRKGFMNKVGMWPMSVLALWLVPSSAHAYVDPGSGMLIYQGLVAAIGITLAVVRHPWASVKRLVNFVVSKLRR